MVAFQWIPFLCGILGNEKADEMTKKGYHISPVSDDPVAYKSSSAKINITVKAKQLSQLKERTKDKLRASDIYNLPGILRSSSVTAFRLAQECQTQRLYITRV
ncbi:hypothetical protein TNCV_389521 [Trichonephila clavipes]|nr:hypothetical protein TNCV_389521 [Trichonephila clavipes]